MFLKTDQILRFFSLFVVLTLFSASLIFIYQQLSEFNYDEVISQFKSVGFHEVIAALSFTFLSYLVLTGYDFLSIKYILSPLHYTKVAIASFIAFAFSYNLGLAVISGGAARYRLFSAWGLSAAEIAKLITFNAITFWIGFLTLSGSLLLVTPPEVPPQLHLSSLALRYVGLLFLVIVLSYIALCVFRKNPLFVKGVELPVPRLSFTFSGIALALIDWLAASAVAYLLLPSLQIGFVHFFCIFLIAQIIGLISHVPGGLGVFEGAFILLISPHLDANIVLGRLIAYRIIYYLVPFLCALTLFALTELYQQKKFLFSFFKISSSLLNIIIPPCLTVATFISGAVLLFSSATPAKEDRLAIVSNLVALPLIEISHFLSSIIGVFLLFIARALQLRTRSSYWLTVLLLSFGLIFSLLKGWDYEEAVFLFFVLLLVIPCRKTFNRTNSLIYRKLPRGWIVSIAMATISTIWLVFFAHKHVEYSNDLFWQFALFEHAPRSLRAIVAAVGLVLFISLTKLFSAPRLEPQVIEQNDFQLLKNIIKAFPRTYAHLALLGDKSILFNHNKTAFIAYGIKGKSCIAFGDPIGADEEQIELIWKFRELCSNYSSYAVFYQVPPLNLPKYLDAGFSLFKLGEEGLVALQKFSLEGKSKASFRNMRNKFTKEGISFEVLTEGVNSEIMAELRKISDSWLTTKHTKEKGFSLGFFDPKYISYFPIALVKRENAILAFANILIGANFEEISLDLMRFEQNVPNGTMDYLFIELMIWAKEQGYKSFNLGMAPLSGMEIRPLAPFWHRFSSLVYKHGEHFYNFEGLRQYKNKFDPVWEPRYLASDSRLAIPWILKDVTTLISGGMKGIITK